MNTVSKARQLWVRCIVIGSLTLGIGAVGFRVGSAPPARPDIETGAWGGTGTNGLRPAAVVRGGLSRTRTGQDIETGAWGGTGTNGLVPDAVVRDAFSHAPASR